MGLKPLYFGPNYTRKCTICNVLEDESHALFHCPRSQYIRAILNPELQDEITVARFVKDIDDMII